MDIEPDKRPRRVDSLEAQNIVQQLAERESECAKLRVVIEQQRRQLNGHVTNSADQAEQLRNVIRARDEEIDLLRRELERQVRERETLADTVAATVDPLRVELLDLLLGMCSVVAGRWATLNREGVSDSGLAALFRVIKRLDDTATLVAGAWEGKIDQETARKRRRVLLEQQENDTMRAAEYDQGYVWDIERGVFQRAPASNFFPEAEAGTDAMRNLLLDELTRRESLRRKGRKRWDS